MEQTLVITEEDLISDQIIIGGGTVPVVVVTEEDCTDVAEQIVLLPQVIVTAEDCAHYSHNTHRPACAGRLEFLPFDPPAGGEKFSA